MDSIPEIVARLEQLYGVPEWKPRQNPLDELIHCILSQHTSDANSFRAYRLMRERYPTWEAVANAPVEELAAPSVRAGWRTRKRRASKPYCARFIRRTATTASTGCATCPPPTPASFCWACLGLDPSARR
jgi:endonuclease III